MIDVEYLEKNMLHDEQGHVITMIKKSKKVAQKRLIIFLVFLFILVYLDVIFFAERSICVLECIFFGVLDFYDWSLYKKEENKIHITRRGD